MYAAYIFNFSRLYVALGLCNEKAVTGEMQGKYPFILN